MVVKRIWMLTHDQYIDRRIFFFADVFKGMGLETKLFASSYFDVTTEPDPTYVIRPTQSIIAKQYGLSKEDVPAEYVFAMERIISREAEFFGRHRHYSKKLSEMGITLSQLGCIGCDIILQSDIYFILLQFDSHVLMYNSITRLYTMSQYKNNRHFLTKVHRVESAMHQYLHTNDGGPVAIVNGINIREAYSDDGGHILYMNDPQMPMSYIYDFSDSTLFEEYALPFTYDESDSIGGNVFEYKEYRNRVYNYSPILTKIKEHLEAEQPDFVYVADLPTLPIGQMLKELTGCKLIVDCHEWWYRQAMLWNAGMKKMIDISEEFEKKLYPACDLRITVGNYLAKEMSVHYDCSFEVIYSCLSADLSGSYSRKGSFWKEILGIPDGFKVVIFQGSMTTLRNLDNLARATAYMKDGQALVIVGGGAYEREFRDVLQKEGNPGIVYFAGWVEQKRLMEYTVNADLGVLPYVAVDDYFSLSAPNKLMEFYAAELPFIFDQSMKEISLVALENGVGVADDLTSPERLGKAIDYYLSTSSELNELKKHYKTCRDRFNYQEQKKHLERLMFTYFGLMPIGSLKCGSL